MVNEQFVRTQHQPVIALAQQDLGVTVDLLDHNGVVSAEGVDPRLAEMRLLDDQRIRATAQFDVQHLEIGERDTAREGLAIDHTVRTERGRRHDDLAIDNHFRNIRQTTHAQAGQAARRQVTDLVSRALAVEDIQRVDLGGLINADIRVDRAIEVVVAHIWQNRGSSLVGGQVARETDQRARDDRLEARADAVAQRLGDRLDVVFQRRCCRGDGTNDARFELGGDVQFEHIARVDRIFVDEEERGQYPLDSGIIVLQRVGPAGQDRVARAVRADVDVEGDAIRIAIGVQMLDLQLGHAQQVHPHLGAVLGQRINLLGQADNHGVGEGIIRLHSEADFRIVRRDAVIVDQVDREGLAGREHAVDLDDRLDPTHQAKVQSARNVLDELGSQAKSEVGAVGTLHLVAIDDHIVLFRGNQRSELVKHVVDGSVCVLHPVGQALGIAVMGQVQAEQLTRDWQRAQRQLERRWRDRAQVDRLGESRGAVQCHLDVKGRAIGADDTNQLGGAGIDLFRAVLRPEGTRGIQRRNDARNHVIGRRLGGYVKGDVHGAAGRVRQVDNPLIASLGQCGHTKLGGEEAGLQAVRCQINVLDPRQFGAQVETFTIVADDLGRGHTSVHDRRDGVLGRAADKGIRGGKRSDDAVHHVVGRSVANLHIISDDIRAIFVAQRDRPAITCGQDTQASARGDRRARDTQNRRQPIAQTKRLVVLHRQPAELDDAALHCIRAIDPQVHIGRRGDVAEA